MGTKTRLNSLLTYLRLTHLPAEDPSLISRLIMTYALCRFANFDSLGIMIDGLTTMIPQRREEIMDLGIKGIFSGTVATCYTGGSIFLDSQTPNPRYQLQICFRVHRIKCIKFAVGKCKYESHSCSHVLRILHKITANSACYVPLQFILSEINVKRQRIYF